MGMTCVSIQERNVWSLFSSYTDYSGTKMKIIKFFSDFYMCKFCNVTLFLFSG